MSAIVNNKPDVPPLRYRKVVCDTDLEFEGRTWRSLLAGATQ